MHDCLIVGGGVIGLSLAYELAQHDLRCCILERGEPGQEASWAGAGILPPARVDPTDPPWDQLRGWSHRLHPRWSAELREATGIDNELRRCGGLYVAHSPVSAAALKRQISELQRRNIEAVALGADDLAALEPAVALPAIEEDLPAAWRLPDECQVRNPRHLKALRVACRQKGVEIVSGAAARDFEVSGRCVTAVRTAGQRYRCGSACICSGSWSGELASRLKCSLPVRPVRGQIALLRLDAPLFGHVVNQAKRYLVARADGYVLVGSTEENAGFAKRTTATGIGGLLQLAASLVPALATAHLERTWAGLRPGTADELPYLGRLPEFENAYIAAGHFRSGLHLSPATAVVMRQLMTGESPEIDLEPFRPDRTAPR